MFFNKINLFKIFFTLLLFFFCLCNLKSQDKKAYISGYITNSDSLAIENATIKILNINIEKKTNREGFFTIELAGNNNYKIEVSLQGKKTYSTDVFLPLGEIVKIEIVLEEDVNELQEVKIYADKNLKYKNDIIKADIIDTKKEQTKSVTLVDLMNRTSGVRVRQSGGLGSNTNVMLNGFQGKSIKILKDGIPIDYLGASFNFTSIPTNLLDRIEVYKGVLPTNLGVDALGGAINLVTNSINNNSLGTSYEMGSFNTHKITFSVNKINREQNLFWGTNLFFNYSDNDYKVNVNVVNPETANISTERIKLFHNKYKQLYTELYAGLKSFTWADELRFGITFYKIDRDNQFAALMEKPFGASKASENSLLIPTIRYKKDFFSKKLNFDQFLAYSKITNHQIDTLRGSYDWYGNYHKPIDSLKIWESGNPTLANINFYNFISRTGMSYKFNSNNNLLFNIVFNSNKREGEDIYGSKTNDNNAIDLLSIPAYYKKLVLGLGWKINILNKNIENILQVKLYTANAKGNIVDINTGYLQNKINKVNTTNFGVAESLKLNFSKTTYLRISGEISTRLPEQSEILGNGAYTLSNFDLKPERSNNANLGLHTVLLKKVELELNTFFRLTKDMILLSPVNLIYSQSTNVESVRGFGFESDISYKATDWIKFNGNVTYQDFRLFNIKTLQLLFLEKARLKNTPYFFGNIGMESQFNNVFNKQDNLKIFYNYSYVHEYYLSYIPKNAEPNGFLGLWGKAKIDAPNIIPSQSIHSIGILWYPKANKPLSINVECKNIFDASVFDNFKIQNAGRSFQIKLNYIIKK